ncbi:MAG: EAL domain-containing protein [Pseudomonadales bacterium]|nr:EAL domain-containing protein [Pseudomonadales bacterium]
MVPIQSRHCQLLPDTTRQSLLRISQRILSKTGDQFFNELALALSDELQADYITIGKLHDPEQITTLAFSESSQLLKNFDYDLVDTPCDTAIRDAICSVPENLPALYPRDPLIVDMGLHAYVGVRLHNARGESSGVLNALYKRPLSHPESESAVFFLSIFGLRASSEIERQATETALRKSEHYANEIFNNSPMAKLTLETDGRITRYNQAFCHLSGYSQDEIVGQNILCLFSNWEEKRINTEIDKLLNQKLYQSKTETTVLTKDKQKVSVLLHSYSLRNSVDHVTSIVFQMENITEKKSSELIIQKLSQAVELSPVATIITDREARIEYANPRFTTLTGYSAKECVGHNTRINASGDTPADVYKVMWNTILAGRQWQGELLNRRKDGTAYWARTTIFPILDRNRHIVNFVSLQEDISETRNLSRQLQHEATHDQLTGLLNRAEFTRRLQQTIDLAATIGNTFALCFLDLDQFRILNDTSGHIAGDTLLMQVGTILQHQLRPNDTAARVGGDEFALILSNCSLDDAQIVAEEILQAVSTIDFTWEKRMYALSVSIGITPIDGSIKDVTELMKQVDTACYTAKDGGRNCIHIYREGNNNVSRHRSETDWVPELTAALAERRFRLFAQKIIALNSGQRKPSYEILIRLTDRNGNLVLPGEFLPSAERYGLISKLDRCVFDYLCQWLIETPHVFDVAESFSINLSGASLSNQDLLHHILDTVSHGHIDPAKIKFEITETAAIGNIVNARYFMEKLRKTGCKLVLDDFGRGLSSFAYLKNLPVDILKIDGLFVTEILKNEADYTMVKMINELAHSLGIETIAEYIESEALLDCVTRLGIDYGQGYAIARPVDIEDLLTPQT